MNWGEPWGAGFREGQTEYRFKNQQYFERNLMPGMLGWFLMTSQTSLEDIEWLLAKAAGYNAGFGFVSNYKSFEENGFTDEILNQIKIWEEARLSGAFDEKTREDLKDRNKEFHLTKVNDDEWRLQKVNIFKKEHVQRERQPGEPVFSKLQFNSSSDNQSIGFIISAFEGGVRDIFLEIDNYWKVVFPVNLQKGEMIKYNGGNSVIIYNKNWQQINEIPFNPPRLNGGEHSITIDCTFIDEKETILKLELRIAEDTEETIRRP